MKGWGFMKFYSTYFQMDESHTEYTYYTIDEPKKSLKQIEKETEEEFLFCASEHKTVYFNEILERNLKENGYIKVEHEESLYFDGFSMDSGRISDLIYNTLHPSEENNWWVDEELIEKVSKIRVKKGKTALVPKTHTTKKSESLFVFDANEDFLKEELEVEEIGIVKSEKREVILPDKPIEDLSDEFEHFLNNVE